MEKNVMKLKSGITIAGILAGLVLCGTAAARDVYVSPNQTTILGNAGIGSDSSSNPAGYIDAYISTWDYTTYRGSTIYIVGKNAQGLGFYCFVNPDNPAYEAMVKAVMSINDTSYIQATRNNYNKCSSISVSN
jgi:hypothetical protein